MTSNCISTEDMAFAINAKLRHHLMQEKVDQIYNNTKTKTDANTSTYKEISSMIAKGDLDLEWHTTKSEFMGKYFFKKKVARVAVCD